MGFEPTTLRDLADALTTETLWWARVKCENRITELAHMNSLTASRNHIKAYHIILYC